MFIDCVEDVHSEIRCIILGLRRRSSQIPKKERERIENIIWEAKAKIGEDFITRERFEQLYISSLNYL